MNVVVRLAGGSNGRRRSSRIVNARDLPQRLDRRPGKDEFGPIARGGLSLSQPGCVWQPERYDTPPPDSRPGRGQEFGGSTPQSRLSPPLTTA